MDEICKLCVNEYPNVECINCGEKHYNFVAKDYPSYLDHPKKTKVMTKYDSIRNVSIENMAEFICNNALRNFCDLICNGECRALGTLNKPADEVCKKIIMHWLNTKCEDVLEGIINHKVDELREELLQTISTTRSDKNVSEN